MTHFAALSGFGLTAGRVLEFHEGKRCSFLFLDADRLRLHTRRTEYYSYHSCFSLSYSLLLTADYHSLLCSMLGGRGWREMRPLLVGPYLLLATCYLPRTTCYLLLATYLLLPTCHLLLATYFSPHTTYYLLLTAYHLPLTTYHLLLARRGAAPSCTTSARWTTRS